MVQAAASPLSCVNLPHSASPHLSKYCRKKSLTISLELAFSHLHATWNKLDGKDFIAAFSLSFRKEPERIGTVLLSMDKIHFWIHQSYFPCDRTKFSPKHTFFWLCNQVYYDLTLAYRNELHLLDFFCKFTYSTQVHRKETLHSFLCCVWLFSSTIWLWFKIL